MKPLSPVFAELARRYRRRHAGRTGRGNQAVVEELEPLLHAAGCADGDARDVAERELKAAEVAGVLQRIPHHPRDPEHTARIQLRPENESAFFRFLGMPSPAEERAALAAQQAASDTSVSLTGIPRDTPAKNIAYLNRAVFGHEGFLREIVSFIPRARFEVGEGEEEERRSGPWG